MAHAPLMAAPVNARPTFMGRSARRFVPPIQRAMESGLVRRQGLARVKKTTLDRSVRPTAWPQRPVMDMETVTHPLVHVSVTSISFLLSVRTAAMQRQPALVTGPAL